MKAETHKQNGWLHDCMKPWSIERQVRFFAGTIILIGLALGCTLSMTWLGLSAFIALGMVFSALANSYALGNILQWMPWNRANEKH